MRRNNSRNDNTALCYCGSHLMKTHLVYDDVNGVNSISMQHITQYSIVTHFVFKYSFSASLPKSLPKPLCLKPPNGAATSVLL